MVEQFWAKTEQGQFGKDGLPAYHPVICHLADTASVAMEIVRHHLNPLVIQRLETGLGLQGESLIRFCGFLAGSHDFGKVSPAFQFQVSEVGQKLLGSTLYDLWSELPAVGEKTPHGTVTAATLPEFLTGLGISKRLAKRLAIIAGGHHGFFPSLTEIRALHKDNIGRGDWLRFRRSIYEQLRDFVGLNSDNLPTHCDNAAAMLTAGLTTVSDWIASNTECFPYASDTTFDKYTESLPQKAKDALAKMGWVPISPGIPLTFTQLFPEIVEPRPLQQTAIALSSTLQPPCLVLVETSMGEGKTETGLYLADTLQHQTGAGGFYVGLPTQATSNAMWERVRKFLKQRYPQEIVNLTLSHSAAALHTDYLKSVCRLEQVYDEEKMVVASEWHTVRKRTLLSPYGVGTIDQGLMGVVQSRHQFVRLFGLAGRTVIVDEIHAYDIYTSTLLERFLEWLALLNSPVIALSATLPKATRQRLLTAYAKGCGCREPELPGDDQYPRMTILTSSGVNSQCFKPSNHVRRLLHIQWFTDEKWAISLQEVLVSGGCAAIICSTVDRAQEVYRRLQAFFPNEELGLFHGRFLFTNREDIEKDCLQKFGKDGGKRPKRFVLIATQVIEQSLDLDFDLIVSDLAPIDLLLQRSGRLHRHNRPRPSLLEQPMLWLVEPTFNSVLKANFGEAGIIYDRHVLLRTWLTLQNHCRVQLPEETDVLIESVYNLEAPIPQGLESVHVKDWQESLETHLLEEQEIKRTKASEVKIPPPQEQIDYLDQFTRHRKDDDEHSIAEVTRLGRRSITLIFLQQTEAGLVLPGSGQFVNLNEEPTLDQIRELLAHSTRISTEGLVKKLMDVPRPKTWNSALLRHCGYVVLNSEGKTNVGSWQLHLDEHLGVVIERFNSSIETMTN